MTSDRIWFACRLALASAMLWAVTGAAPAYGQVDPDTDADGVVDSLDQCPDTEPEELVDAVGCDVCACDGPNDVESWTSHEQYVGCVITEAKARRAAKTIKRPHMRQMIKRARKATCGNENLTRCCVYAHLDDEAEVNMGVCRVVTIDQCDNLSMREDLDWVEDLDMGSCSPNPCQF